MSLVITRGLPETYKLDRSDPSGETYVVIKPATVAEQAKRDELFSNQVRTYRAGQPDAIEIRGETTPSTRKALEVFLTMVDCNITYQPLGANGEPSGDAVSLFKFGKTNLNEPRLDMDRVSFADAWGRLPQEVADEIYEKVMRKNPQWDPFQGTLASQDSMGL